MFDTFLMMKSEHAYVVLVTGLVACDPPRRPIHFRLQAIGLTIAHWFHVDNAIIVTTRPEIPKKV